MTKDRNRRMPDGSWTGNVDEYGEAWTSLGKEVCKALGEGSAYGFDPDIQIHFRDRPHEVLTLPVWVAQRIVELHKQGGCA